MTPTQSAVSRALGLHDLQAFSVNVAASSWATLFFVLRCLCNTSKATNHRQVRASTPL
ncbi:hypothetical protein SK128_014816, partial [Halocaridina rubra]